MSEWVCRSMKPGATTSPLGVHYPLGARPLEPTHGDDLVVPDSHVGAEPRVTGAVHDPTAPDEDVEGAVSPAVGGSSAGAKKGEEEERGERGRKRSEVVHGLYPSPYGIRFR